MALHLKSTGIDFTDFSDATESSELLDDYEEGSWTPTNTNSGERLTRRNGFYTKFGRVVECRGDILVINTTSTTNLPTAGAMGGLPFNSSNEITNDSWGAGGGWVTYSNGFSSSAIPSCIVNSNSSTFWWYTGHAVKQLPSNKNAKFTILYTASA